MGSPFTVEIGSHCEYLFEKEFLFFIVLFLNTSKYKGEYFTDC